VSGFNAATGTLQTSGTAIGASGYDGNNNTKFQSNVVYPNASGIITLEVKSENATFGYINAMQMEEFSGLQTQDILVDFGPNDGTNGNITSSPDANGNHWNNVTGSSAGNITAGIVNNTNTATGFSITTVSAFGTNGIVHGGLLAPSAALLGNLAINTATQDYFFTGGTADIKFTGLNPSNGYVFTAFGSRSLSTATRISNYSFAGLNTSSGTLQTTGNNIGSDGIYDGNDNNVYKSAVVYPTAGGEITFTVSSSPVTIAYINAMKITEYNFQVPVIAPPPPPPPSVPISMWSIVAAFVLICTVILMRSFKLSV